MSKFCLSLPVLIFLQDDVFILLSLSSLLLYSFYLFSFSLVSFPSLSLFPKIPVFWKNWVVVKFWLIEDVFIFTHFICPFACFHLKFLSGLIKTLFQNKQREKKNKTKKQRKEKLGIWEMYPYLPSWKKDQVCLIYEVFLKEIVVWHRTGTGRPACGPNLAGCLFSYIPEAKNSFCFYKWFLKK